MVIETPQQLRKIVSRNLFEYIVPFWQSNALDLEFGGFYGKIGNNLEIDQKASKSLILNSRILWSFAALYRFQPDDAYRDLARRAYDYLIGKFIDNEFGGYYWLLNYRGEALDNFKKMYGQAFVIYALCEYYGAIGDRAVLDRAIELFQLIEEYNHDDRNRGYFEAAHRDWTVARNIALSAVDLAESKSMNTHLHMMEAYTNLYRYWKNDRVRERLKELIECHFAYIIDPQTFHLQLFFDEGWTAKSQVISFGHDIECSWLLTEAAEVLENSRILSKSKEYALKMVNATSREGISPQYSIFLEKGANGIVKRDRFDWWYQVEAVVGFLNAYQISRRSDYLNYAMKIWTYIENTFVDTIKGEWYYSVDKMGVPLASESKVSEWKGPYHNIRACIEILQRLEKFNNS